MELRRERFFGPGLRRWLSCRRPVHRSAPDYFSCGDKEFARPVRSRRRGQLMDRADRSLRPQSDRARTQAGAECPCDAARRRRSAARSRHARHSVAARAQTKSARPLNALRAKARAANALCRCGDVANDLILHASNAARALFPEPAAAQRTWECARAKACGLQSLCEWLR